MLKGPIFAARESDGQHARPGVGANDSEPQRSSWRNQTRVQSRFLLLRTWRIYLDIDVGDAGWPPAQRIMSIAICARCRPERGVRQSSNILFSWRKNLFSYRLPLGLPTSFELLVSAAQASSRRQRSLLNISRLIFSPTAVTNWWTMQIAGGAGARYGCPIVTFSFFKRSLRERYSRFNSLGKGTLCASISHRRSLAQRSRRHLNSSLSVANFSRAAREIHNCSGNILFGLECPDPPDRTAIPDMLSEGRVTNNGPLYFGAPDAAAVRYNHSAAPCP